MVGFGGAIAACGRGKMDGRWWGNIDLSEKKKDSPYNTYVYIRSATDAYLQPGTG